MFGNCICDYIVKVIYQEKVKKSKEIKKEKKKERTNNKNFGKAMATFSASARHQKGTYQVPGRTPVNL